MTSVRPRGEDIRTYILQQVEEHPTDIAKVTADHFGISRQAANNHLRRLTSERVLVGSGTTRSKSYSLCSISTWKLDYDLNNALAEDVVWRDDVSPNLGKLPENVLGIWHYAFTEMFNNAIDHSEGSRVTVKLQTTAVATEMMISDNGIGIFKKIQEALGLLDPRHAILELSKGKLTTDPARHTGEGIFFSSRMFDSFDIVSEGAFFSHEYGDKEDWILEVGQLTGTLVYMKLKNHTSRSAKKVFDKFTSGDDIGFTKTVVPVKLAQYGNDQLISRSQAKRVVARVERFKVVVFDFSDVVSIGQAFADEIFRVFARQHPEIELVPIKTNSAVKRMIERARAEAQATYVIRGG